MGSVMRIIPADEFGANWLRLLSQLTDGEEFLLTDRGQPVGRVLPPVRLNRSKLHLTPAEREREFP